MKKIFAVVLFFNLFVSSAFAVYWKQIDATRYIDIDSVKYTNNKNNVRIWVKYIENGEEEYLGKKINQTFEYVEYDCQNVKSRVLTHIIYDANGDVIRSFDEPTKWRYIVPDSNGESQYNLFCSESMKKIYE